MIPAPARFPYYEHRTVEQVDADRERIRRTAQHYGLRPAKEGQK